MVSLGQRQANSAMDCSPRYTANLLPASSRMELHPPAGDADPWLHRDYLSPRPHRPVSIGSLETEPKVTSLAGQARLLQDCTPTPHVFPSLFTCRRTCIRAGHPGQAENTEMQGKGVAPTPTQVRFYEANDRTRAKLLARQLRFRTDEVHKNSSCVQVGI